MVEYHRLRAEEGIPENFILPNRWASNLMSLMEGHVLKQALAYMYFGGVNGFNVFNPSEVHASEVEPEYYG